MGLNTSAAGFIPGPVHSDWLLNRKRDAALKTPQIRCPESYTVRMASRSQIRRVRESESDTACAGVRVGYGVCGSQSRIRPVSDSDSPGLVEPALGILREGRDRVDVHRDVRGGGER